MADNFDELFNVPLTEPTETMLNASAGSRNRSGSTTTGGSLDDSTASSTAAEPPVEYKPLSYHWFFSSMLLDKLIWVPMSFKDSQHLEKIFLDKKDLIRELRKKPAIERKSNHIVTVKGGRFEVDLVELIRKPIYWDEAKVCQVKRCLWFYKENNEEFMPYDEDYCEFLETEYEKCLKTNGYHKRIEYTKIIESPTEAPSSLTAAVPSQPPPQQPSSPLPPSSDASSPSLPTATAAVATGQRQMSVCVEEAFVFHSATVMLHYTQAAHSLDEFGNLMTSDARRPRVVKRGLDDVISREKIEPDELDRVDHVCFVVHGIGEGCDLKFRTLVECVDDFRELGAFIIDSHLRSHVEQQGLHGRIEFIPITWHDELHGDATGVDERLKPITLPSIPKLRQYSNTTILDVLFYTSPIYCQTIISKVGNELNRLYQVFVERNPYFCGSVSLVGHSLGSLILFDLLMHQFDPSSTSSDASGQMTALENMNLQQQDSSRVSETSVDEVLIRLKLTEFKSSFVREKINLESFYLLTESDLIQMGLPIGPRRIVCEEIRNRALQREREEVGKKIKNKLADLRRAQKQELNQEVEKKSDDYFNYGLAGTGQLIIKYPQLYFKVKNFFALGSPIAVFLAVRGVEKLSPEFKLPNCEGFFNIFHPYDPVAYRFEPLINIKTSFFQPPVLMAHHKGRKRLHLELKENFTKVSEDLKQKVVEQFRTTWTSITELAKMPKLGGGIRPEAITNTEGATASSLVAEQQTTLEPSIADTSSDLEVKKQVEVKGSQEIRSVLTEDIQLDVSQPQNMGRLNNGRRIDYILQERPIESFNEYLFALASHACYWESEDTLLLLVKEMYGVGNSTDLNTETNLTEQQQQMSSWLTQAAVSALPANMQKTINSYFNFTSMMPNLNLTSINNRAQNTQTNAASTSTTSENNSNTTNNPK